MFSFDLLRIDLRTFFPAFLSTWLSQSYIHDRRVCELIWFNWFFCLFFFKKNFQFYPSTLDCLILRMGGRVLFIISSVIIFFQFLYCGCIFYSYYLNYQLN